MVCLYKTGQAGPMVKTNFKLCSGFILVLLSSSLYFFLFAAFSALLFVEKEVVEIWTEYNVRFLCKCLHIFISEITLEAKLSTKVLFGKRKICWNSSFIILNGIKKIVGLVFVSFSVYIIRVGYVTERPSSHTNLTLLHKTLFWIFFNT